MVRSVRARSGLAGLPGAVYFALASMIAVIGTLVLSFSAFAAGPPQGPPIDGHTSSHDSRCLRVDTENLFFINQPTPASGNPAPGDTIGTWFSDESGLNQGSAKPTSPFFIAFHLTGPGVSQDLPADTTTQSFDQHTLFDTTYKECKIQVNITTVIPTALKSGAYPPGNYTVTMTAWDNDQTRQGGDHSDATWHFSIASPQPTPTPTPTPSSTPSPSPTAQVSPTSQPSPVSQVLAASTTGPGLPQAGAGAGTLGPAGLVATVLLLAFVGTLSVAVARTIRGRRLQ